MIRDILLLKSCNEFIYPKQVRKTYQKDTSRLDCNVVNKVWR